MLKYIRENAFAYIHGHEVGGTNPSLLEALASTKLNLLLDVGFNREVGQDGAMYWIKNENNLSCLIDNLESGIISKDNYPSKARKYISDNFTWRIIIEKYENEFMR